MSTRDLLVLGTASAVPTKTRNHNGYLVRWDGQGLLFDPGEGTQRQMIRAGVAAHDINWIFLTHFHGDHCLGLPGVIQRIARDGVEHPVRAVFPASGREYWERLRHASVFVDTRVVEEHPIGGARVEIDTGGAPFTLTARRLQHPVEAYGYRLEEPDGITMLPERLAEHGIAGPLVGQLQREGRLTAPDGRIVTLEECSVPRPGQKLAFVMDTRICDAVFELAEGVDMLIVESTFLAEDEPLARRYAHLTARQAGQVAAACRVRRLVLTHFSERYTAEDFPRFTEQATEFYHGDVVLARDLEQVPVPPRRRPVRVQRRAT
ncbi:ribonuclease Z [Thermomonospora catenispora]|uniref:ribonuclease Z n=1 Tax=Thermomonospora catenispora TaxID=2493090 RepID=UPI001124C1B0|nr:ribonuclease Z [Thermomonospora catenispora]TNY35446.1 ribonuclease Z [Thermomonospora catenispora]